MTAINVIVKPDAVHLLADGAIVARDEAGRYICGRATKITSFTHLPAAFALRGTGVTRLVAASYFSGAVTFEDFDKLVIDAADAMRHRVLPEVEKLAPTFGTDFDMYLIGWSAERDRPEAYSLHNHSCGGREPWKLYEISRIDGTPFDKGLVDRVTALGVNLRGDVDPERDGRIIMTEQRARLPGNIGFFAELTTITRDAVTSRIIERWPDKIGDRAVEMV